MRLRTPATRILGRARLVFTLTALIPTILLSALGIILLAAGQIPSVPVVAGILVLCFCAVGLAGFSIGNFFVGRGAALAAVQNEFLALVSHELRTPLTSIRMFIDTLREGRIDTPEERQHCLSIIHRELGRLDGMVGSIIELSKIEHRHAVFDRQRVRVDDILADAVSAFAAIEVGGPSSLSVTIQPDLWILGDRAALARAVGNLLANAWKYTPAGNKRIVVAVVGDAKRVTISVTDNGGGLLGSEKESIFEMFRRGSAAEHQGKQGSGLGLAIVRAVVEAHRGTVDAKSDGTNGSRFRILLPRHREAA